MFFLILVFAALQAPPAGAVPGSNVVIQPDRVTKARGKVRVDYTLPCEMNDSSQVVMSNDDTGDRLVAVGVVVSLEERNCHRGPAKRFSETVDPKAYGYSMDDAFTPMPVDGGYDRELERYVGTRLTASEGGRPSVQELIRAAGDARMEIVAGTLRCLGYPSWEGNRKAVGACLVEAASPGEQGVRVMMAVEVADDTEHPGNPRTLTVHQVSYRL